MLKIKLLNIFVNNDVHTLTDYDVRHSVNDLDDFYAFKFYVPDLIVPVNSFKGTYDNVTLSITFVDGNNREYIIDNITINLNSQNDFMIEEFNNKTYVKFVKDETLFTNDNIHKVILCLRGNVNDIFLENGIFIIKYFLKCSLP